MQFKKFLLVLGVLTLVIAQSGCAKAKAKPKPNLEVQKQVVHTYLEGLRDHNLDKIRKTIIVGLKTQTLDPNFKIAFAAFDRDIGQIKSWVLMDEGSWVDEVNGQTLIKTKLSTSKRKLLPLDIDLRKDDKRWIVYSIRISESGKMNEDKAYFNNPHNKSSGKTSNSGNGTKENTKITDKSANK